MVDSVKKHKHTIKMHRKAVRKACFKMGIPLQGLLHDLSKYSKVEMKIAKWYVGTRSPHDVARDELGYSPSWYHHKNKNKHHWEYWTDFNSAVEIDGKMYLPVVGVKIPYKYIIEMFCDFIGAGKAYRKGTWNTSMPLEYWYLACEGKRVMHKTSEKLFVLLLKKMSSCSTEHEFYKWYKSNKKDLKAKYRSNSI